MDELPVQKNIDAYGALIEIDNEERKLKKNTGYFKSYTWSILIPPIGIFFFIKYFFLGDGSMSDKKAGIIALALTIASLLFSIWIFGALFSAGTGDLNNSKNLEFLKEMSTPENQQRMRELYK
jgi:hypothetical protein